MASILITGASGLLGGNLAADYAERHEVWGVFNQHQLRLPGVRMIGADLTDEQQALMIVGKVKPDLIVHCAAATDIDRCQRDPDWAFQLNRDMAAGMARAASQYDADMIHISTDAVFSSDDMPHTEDEEPSPNNVYAESKLAGEKAVLQIQPKGLVVRTNLFGWNLRPGKSSLAEWFLQNFSENRSVKGFADAFFSPLLVNDLGALLLELWRARASGVLHVGGADCLSKFEFGRRLADVFGFEPELVENSTIAEVGLEAPRAKKLCLDSSKATSILSKSMPALDDMLQRFKALTAEASIGSGLPASSLDVSAEL